MGDDTPGRNVLPHPDLLWSNVVSAKALELIAFQALDAVGVQCSPETGKCHVPLIDRATCRAQQHWRIFVIAPRDQVMVWPSLIVCTTSGVSVVPNTLAPTFPGPKASARPYLPLRMHPAGVPDNLDDRFLHDLRDLPPGIHLDLRPAGFDRDLDPGFEIIAYAVESNYRGSVDA